MAWTAWRWGCLPFRPRPYPVIALLVAESNIAIVVAALLGACLGFLPYNFNPAKIFMGDTGSTFLGFILASLSIQGMFKLYAIISFAVPFLMLGIPIFDICFAIIRRLAKHQNPMKADRGHIHHRLIDMGFSQKQAVAITVHADGYAGPGGCGAHLLGRGTGPHPHRGGVCGRRHWLPPDFQPEPPTPAGAAGGSK
ncbi:MAG: MraY family glycosyltransferase [Oscillospiraceae bacterium]